MLPGNKEERLLHPHNWRSWPWGGGRVKIFLCNHFGDAEALFCYINLQVTDSVGGGKTIKKLSVRGNTPAPLQARVWTACKLQA